MAKKSAKTDEAPAPKPEPESPEPDGKKERLTDMAHSEELSRMVERLDGLTMALDGVGNLCGSIISGVSQLAEDCHDWMKECAEAFEAERRLRMTPEKRALNTVKEERQ